MRSPPGGVPLRTHRPGPLVAQSVRGAAVFLAAVLSVAGTGSAGAAPSVQDGIDAYLAGAPAHALAMFVQIARARPRSALPAIWAGVAATAAGRIHDAEIYFCEGLRRPHSAFQERITRGWLRRLEVLKDAAGAGAPGRGTARMGAGMENAIAAFARATNPRLTSEQASRLGAHVVTAAREAGLDPWLLAAVIYVESRFDHRSTSPAGAEGLGELMPETARAAGVDPSNLWENLRGTTRILRAYYREFQDWSLALAAYNAGDGAVRRYGGVPPYAETRWYVSAVWAVYHRIRAAGQPAPRRVHSLSRRTNG